MKTNIIVGQLKTELKEEFKEFFKKHPKVQKIPLLMTIVIPKYECKGERITHQLCYGDLLKYTEYFKTEYKNLEVLLEEIAKDLPEIDEEDAFYIFGENNMITVEYDINKDEVVFEVIDYADKIFGMY